MTAPRLKRILLPQGELAQFYDGEEGIQYMAFVEFRPGGVRGNHYHLVKREFVYLFEGEILLHVQEASTGLRESVSVRAGDLVLIQTGIAHAMQTVDPGKGVEFSPARFDPADVHALSLA